MAQMRPKIPRSQESIPFWRDIRVLGVLAQIAFVILVLIAASWFLRNVTANITTLGENQFLCRDGTTSLRCAFDWLRLDASFDISETLIAYDPTDSYGRALVVGVLNTVRITVIGIVMATILGTFAGIARLSDNWLVSSVARWYVDIFRNTPLLVQLFFIFFGVILVFPSIREAIQLLGLPIYLSQRGINLPWPVALPSWPIWMAFIVLGIIQAQVLWVFLGRQEERTGKASNRGVWAIVSFLVVVTVGWFVTSASADSQGMLVANSLRVRQFRDVQSVMVRRLRLTDLSEFDLALQGGQLTQETVDSAAFTVCSISDSPSEANLTALFRRSSIPYRIVERANRPDGATRAYGDGECEIYVANLSVLASERNMLENPDSHSIVKVPETPVRVDIPRIEGLNFTGGLKLSPNFAAILLGLVLYTGAFIAEIVRAGIQSVPKGQSEAARALGLSEGQRLRLVVLPQALRVIIPPMTSQYLNLAKNSSLAIAVGFPDLWSTAFTTLNQSGRAVQVFVLVMAFYLTLSLSISFLLNWYNRRIALVER
jgi:general L-amino acid transport system permease protein